jgi:hypothetical protein
VHEQLYHRVCERLRDYGVSSFSGFVWGHGQEQALAGRAITYDPLLVFTRDLLPQLSDGNPPDVAYLERRERELGVSIQRMLASERHQLAGRTHDQLLRMAEVALREIGAGYDRIRPDFAFSESVSCFHSYVHYVLAEERGIPFWCLGHGRLRGRIAVYRSASQRWAHTERLYEQLRARHLSEAETAEAQRYIDVVTAKPVAERGNDVRAKTNVDRAEVSRFGLTWSRYFDDPHDPTSTAPWRAIGQRARRIARVRVARSKHLFEPPVAGEKYVLYPIHFQPEASTLVQAPMYLDQLALLQDIAKSLPIGHRLYVKEHVVNTGRWPIAFYEAIRAIPAVRLLGPDEPTWPLIQNASAIAVITGTMGFEGLLFGKPVITFGDVYFNLLPHVYKAGSAPKDAWYDLFRRATHDHREDRDALLAFVSAMQQTTYPGSLANAIRVPEVLSSENVALVTSALAQAAGLRRAGSAGAAHERRASSTK